MNAKQASQLLILWAIGVIFLVSLPMIFPSFELVWELSPSYYSCVCTFLLLLFVSGTELLKRRRYFTYLIVIVCAFVAFNNQHQLLSWLDISSPFSDLRHMQQLRIRFTFRALLRLIIIATVIYHLVVLHHERQKMIQSKLRAELAMLKSQITPHFFFNSLNAIYGLALAKSDKVPRAIISLSDLMRYVLTDGKQDWIPISQELDYLNRYVELQRLRLPLKTTLHYHVEQQGESNIPPMLLITFYENAFKYGASSQIEAEICIELIADEEQLHLRTRNAIVVESSQENSTGHGIAHARQRLELMYPHRHELDISTKDGYYQLELTIKNK